MAPEQLLPSLSAFLIFRDYKALTKTQMNCDSSLCLAYEDACRVSRAPWYGHYPTPATKNYLVQNVNNSKVEKLCSRVALYNRIIMTDTKVIKNFLIATLKRNR